jgi:hypothetical protein
MSSNKEESMSQSKNTKQSKRRGGLLRLRLRVPAREENATRSRDVGDVRLQFLLDASTLSR